MEPLAPQTAPFPFLAAMTRARTAATGGRGDGDGRCGWRVLDPRSSPERDGHGRSYLAVWTVVGLAAYVLYQPHGTLAAGALTVAAGVYELTPLKRACRRRCRESVRSGFVFGLYCVGSSIGLMVMLTALGVMSVTWMAVIAALVLAQKLLPPRASIDAPLALAIIALGILVIAAPSSVPGLTPTM